MLNENTEPKVVRQVRTRTANLREVERQETGGDRPVPMLSNYLSISNYQMIKRLSRFLLHYTENQLSKLLQASPLQKHSLKINRLTVHLADPNSQLNPIVSQVKGLVLHDDPSLACMINAGLGQELLNLQIGKKEIKRKNNYIPRIEQCQLRGDIFNQEKLSLGYPQIYKCSAALQFLKELKRPVYLCGISKCFWRLLLQRWFSLEELHFSLCKFQNRAQFLENNNLKLFQIQLIYALHWLAQFQFVFKILNQQILFLLPSKFIRPLVDLANRLNPIPLHKAKLIPEKRGSPLQKQAILDLLLEEELWSSMIANKYQLLAEKKQPKQYLQKEFLITKERFMIARTRSRNSFQ